MWEDLAQRPESKEKHSEELGRARGPVRTGSMRMQLRELTRRPQ